MRFTVRFLFVLTFIVAAVLGVFRWINAAREAVRQWRPTNTVTGYRFPVIPDITGMEVRRWRRAEDGVGKEADFDASKESWSDILAALSPSEIDPKPCPWQAIGQLRIRTNQGQDSCVNLFSLEEAATGAFSAGPDFDTVRYYRGGNTAQLQSALSKAHAEFQRSQARGSGDQSADTAFVGK
jgi:hypothetical protein